MRHPRPDITHIPATFPKSHARSMGKRGEKRTRLDITCLVERDHILCGLAGLTYLRLRSQQGQKDKHELGAKTVSGSRARSEGMARTHACPTCYSTACRCAKPSREIRWAEADTLNMLEVTMSKPILLEAPVRRVVRLVRSPLSVFISISISIPTCPLARCAAAGFRARSTPKNAASVATMGCR